MARTPTGLPPKSLFGRSKELLGLAARVLGKEQLDQAHLLVESLGHLKGAAMKAGQLLSLEARDFLPPEVVDVLSQLQDKSEAMPEAKVREILERELHVYYREIEGLSAAPMASASIGQVHAARFRGQEVALKVQFPGVADSIGTDLFLLRKIAEGFVRLSGRNMNLDSVFSELAIVLRQEVDYVQEATFMEEYAELAKNEPRLVVPRPVCELTTGRVLGMSLERGVRVDDWIKSGPSKLERESYARLFLDLHVFEFLRNGLVQTDPNFANFLIRPDEGKLVVLDFGAMKRFTPQFRSRYSGLLALILEGGDSELLAEAFSMGLLSPKESNECQDLFLRMLRLSAEPFAAARQPFNFGASEYSREIREASLAFTKKIRHSPPPHSILFLHRKLGGIFRLLQTLNVSLDLTSYRHSLLGASPPP
jgi:aarF domain-containing kinase